MNLIVSYTAEAIDDQRTELCEHKGDGHPDGLCDGIAEAVSQALWRLQADADALAAPGKTLKVDEERDRRLPQEEEARIQAVCRMTWLPADP